MDKSAQNSTDLTTRQIQSITAVLQSRSISEGVKKAKVSRRQFYQWLQDPVFKSEFTRQRNEVINVALDELKASIGSATEVLKNLLKSKNESIRFRVAEGIIEKVLKAVEIENIEERLTKLERELEADGKY